MQKKIKVFSWESVWASRLGCQSDKNPGAVNLFLLKLTKTVTAIFFVVYLSCILHSYSFNLNRCLFYRSISVEILAMYNSSIILLQLWHGKNNWEMWSLLPRLRSSQNKDMLLAWEVKDRSNILSALGTGIHNVYVPASQNTI